MINKIINAVLGIIALVAVISAVYFWYHKQTVVNNPTVYVPQKQIQIVEKIKRVEVPVEKIVTLEKLVAVEKLHLPEWIKDNADKQIVATAVIEPYEGKTNAVATIDIKTGVSEIIAKQEPLSLFGLVNDKRIYGRIGYDTHSKTQVSLGAKWDFVRVGSMPIGVFIEGSNRNDGEAIVGIEIGFRF